MVKCSFCGFENDDGLTNCDKCKTDLSALPIFQSAQQSAAPALVVAHDSPTNADEEIVQTLQFSKISLVAPLERDDDVETTPRTLLKAPAPAVPQGGAAPLPIGSTPPVPAPAAAPAPAAVKVRLVVIRGEKIDMQYPIYPGKNFMGRTDEKPVDIDLENQEPPDRVWSSRQHAVITFENGELTIEDLNSLNGTFVNRSRVHPGQVRPLQANDIVQIGNVQMRVVLE